MSYKPIVKMQGMGKKQFGGYRHPNTRTRDPLTVSARQHAEHLLRGRLTTRDLEIVRALIGVGMLTRHQIQRMFFNDHTKVAANRLTKLYHYHFLNRSTYWLEDMGREGFERCYIYTVGAAGLEAFALRSGIKRSEIPFTPQRYKLSREDHFLLHDLRISEMFTRLWVRAQTQGWELLWFNEKAAIIRQGDNEIVRPDGVAVLLGRERPAAFFIEMDRGHTDWEKKIRAYERARQWRAWREVLHVQEWKPEFFPPVLCVAPAGLRDTVRAVVQQQQPVTRFYLQTWEAFLTGDVLRAWEELRSGQITVVA